MKLFLDTANLDDIRRAAATGLICGVTTNPTLAARENRNFRLLLQEILDMTNGLVFAEVVSADAAGMVREGHELAAMSPRIVVKIPAVWEGFQAAAKLHQDGVKTAVTLVYAPTQALMAAVAGADYVAPFLGRAAEIGIDGIASVRQIAQLYREQNIATQILAASVRTAQEGWNAALAGAHILTAPLKVLQQMAHHPQTVVSLQGFMDDWQHIENL